MVDFLYSLDVALFYVVNHTLQNGIFDVLMPWVTDINKHWSGRITILVVWIFLLTRAGTAGRTAALLLIPSFLFSDQLNSSVLKFMFDRPRPCHVLSDVRLLVPCGSGFSFPSSHAVNNFSAAVVLAAFLPRWRWAFFGWAVLISCSRVYVGVHYPSDVLGGATVGTACGFLLVMMYRYTEIHVKRWVDRRKEKNG